MLSYRHAFHAGNHADVFKHMVLTVLVQSLLHKDKPFFYLDTHAGAGRYRLNSEMARKTQEADSGILRVWGAKEVPQAVRAYLDVVAATNPGRDLLWYPGSPRIVRPCLRPSDRMVLSELHPNEVKILAAEFAGDRQVRVENMDGYQAVRAFLPPPERRGLVHIDPAFELKNERQRLLEAVSEGVRRWPTGIFAIWYPVQDRAAAEDFTRRFRRLGVEKVLMAELCVLPDEANRLNGSGVIVINPPWRVEESLKDALPWLAERLAVEGHGRWRVTSEST